MKDLVLAQIDRAIAALEEDTLQKVKEIIAMAEAAQVFGRRVKRSVRTMNFAGVVRLRAERKLGEMLKDAPKASAGRHKKIGSKLDPISKTPTLESIEISKQAADRARYLAKASKADFEAALIIEPKERIEIGLSEDLNHNRVVKDIKEKIQRETRKKTRTKAEAETTRAAPRYRVRPY